MASTLQEPQSAFHFFCIANRRKVSRSLGESPTATSVEKELDNLWHDLDDAAKLPYQRKAAKDRELYLRDKAELDM